MPNHDLTPDCGRIRNELSSYLYGELAAEATAAVEQHLAGCAACSDELSGMRDTRKLLGRWETPRGGEDPRQLARSIAELAGAEESRAPGRARGRRVRWSAALLGAAAALLFTLSVVNTDATIAGGNFQLSFRLPGARPADTHPGWEDVRAIANQVCAAQSASLQSSQQELMERWSRMNREELQQELLRFSQAIDVVLAQNQRSWDDRLVHLGQRAARADLEQRRVISDLAAYVVPASQSNR
jgi:hypothetical protein